MEYQDYLKLWALLIGEGDTGEYGVHVEEGVVRRYYVCRLKEGGFVKRLSVIERFGDTPMEDDLYDAEYIRRFGQSKLRLDLFMTYWERMQEAGMVLCVQ